MRLGHYARFVAVLGHCAVRQHDEVMSKSPGPPKSGPGAGMAGQRCSRLAANVCVGNQMAFYSLEMPTISPEQLRGQLREMVELLAAPADAQIHWLVTEGIPVDELMLQFDDAVPAWFARLRLNGLLSDVECDELQRLRGLLEEMARHHIWEDEALRTAPEWADVREAATKALGLMA